MLYHSTNHKSPKVKLAEAIMHSEAPDGGLYMPDRIIALPQAIFNNISELSNTDISYFVANTLFGQDAPSSALKRIGEESLSFPMPLVEVEPGIYALELFHGPTLSVKDVGTRFMARLKSALRPDLSRKLNVLLATNGHSGAAIANSFYGLNDVNVFVLYPKSIARPLAANMASLGGNVRAYEVNGTIDDCRRMVEAALTDSELNDRFLFTCANSVNIGRVLPSAVNAFIAYARLKEANPKADNVHLSIPCGNGGNLLSSLMAMRMGLPAKRLVAACNANDPYGRFLSGSSADRAMSMRTSAYAMDTCRLANGPRFSDLVAGRIEKLNDVIVPFAASDKEIAEAIGSVYASSGYVLDPHGAVAYLGLKRNLPEGASGVFMATAHPVRSRELVSKIIGRDIQQPAQFARYKKAGRVAGIPMPPTFPALKKQIIASLSE